MTHFCYFSKKLEGVQIFEKTKLNLPPHEHLEHHLWGYFGVMDHAEFNVYNENGPNNACPNCVGVKRYFEAKTTLRGRCGLKPV